MRLRRGLRYGGSLHHGLGESIELKKTQPWTQADDYLAKPFPMDGSFLKRIESILRLSC
jgi:hypothetical protein